MPLSVKTTQEDGRRFEIATPYLDMAGVVSRDGTVEIESVEWKDPRSRGLGDTIAKATTAVGIKPCGGCKKRKKWLNKLMPYRGSNG